MSLKDRTPCHCRGVGVDAKMELVLNSAWGGGIALTLGIDPAILRAIWFSAVGMQEARNCPILVG